MIHQSRADYLRAIYLLRRQKCEVREYEIAEAMGYSKASVCRMMKIMSAEGYVSIAQNNVCLTLQGLKTAETFYERYLVIREILISVLKLPEPAAECEACRLEHSVGSETINALREILDKKGIYVYDYDNCPSVDQGL